MNISETSEPSLVRGDQEAKQWAHERAAAFGEAVQFWRKKLGLTAVDLANRTKEVGYPITRATIAKIENNSRNSKVDLAEISALAAALRVAPVDLIFPGQPSANYRVTPRSPMSADGCASWFSADMEYPESSSFRVGGPHTPLIDNSIELRRAIGDYETYCKAIGDHPEIKNADHPFGGPDAQPIYIEGARQYKRHINDRKYRIESLGGKVHLPLWYSRLEEPKTPPTYDDFPPF